MPDVDLVVTDLDGSLWWTDDFIHPDTLAAWDALTAAGVAILVATGRRLASTSRPFAAHGLAPAAVMLNGALGVDLGTQERFHLAAYDPDEAADVLAAHRAEGLDPCVYVAPSETADVFVSSTPSTHPGHLASFGPAARVDDLDRVVGEEAVLGFSVLGVDRGPLERVAAALVGRATPHVDVSIEYGDGAMTVAPLHQSKWDGVLAYATRHGLDAGRVLAVGDGPNDVELLDAASIAAVPRSASQAALERADVVIGPPAEGGWAEILDHALGPRHR